MDPVTVSSNPARSQCQATATMWRHRDQPSDPVGYRAASPGAEHREPPPDGRTIDRPLGPSEAAAAPDDTKRSVVARPPQRVIELLF